MYPSGYNVAKPPQGFPSSTIYRDPIVGNPKDPGLGHLPPYLGGPGGDVTPPPVAAPITAPGSTGGAFGGMPDFSSMIGGSWEVGAAESMLASQMKAARASFQTQLRQGFIDLGFQGAIDKDSGLSNFSKYIDKDTMQKAIDNKYSAYANIKKQEAEANAINDASLAARGGMTSGTQTETTQDTIGQAEQARYEGLRNFLGQGQAGLSNLTSMQNQLAQGVMQARFAAAQRLAQEYAFAHPYQPPGMGGSQVDIGTGYGGGTVTPGAQQWLDQPTYYGTSIDEQGNAYKQPLPKWWGQP
jgi:hypothetical protein